MGEDLVGHTDKAFTASHHACETNQCLLMYVKKSPRKLYHVCEKIQPYHIKYSHPPSFFQKQTKFPAPPPP